MNFSVGFKTAQPEKGDVTDITTKVGGWLNHRDNIYCSKENLLYKSADVYAMSHLDAMVAPQLNNLCEQEVS
jgi:hypothetical protein